MTLQPHNINMVRYASHPLSLTLMVSLREKERLMVYCEDSEMGRSPCCAKEGLNRGAWTATEDRILTESIKVHGEGKWRNLPKKAGLKRCGKSCRLRWLNYLRPDIKRGNITHDEEELIIRLHKLLGNRWSLIAGRLPGRTDNEIKNYWNTNIGKKIMQGPLSSSPNHRTMIQSDEKLNPLTDSPKHRTMIQSDEKLNPVTDSSSIRSRTSPETRPPVYYAKPSRCTKVFFPTEPLGNDQVLETRPVLLGPSMVQELAKGPDSPPLIPSGDPDFEMDADFISEFLNSDFLQLCEFNNGVEADSMYTSNTSQYSSSMEAPSLLINEETLQNPNLFSIDSFLDSEMDWFC